MMKTFKHINARTVSEATKLLKDDAKANLIAGGTDLLGILKDRILSDYPETVINIKTIPDLGYIREDSAGLRIGALARLDDIANSPLVRGKYGILAEAAEAVATPQVRRMGTIGGNLCQDVRCWYYRSPHQIGGRIDCYLKGGKKCYALTGENQYHSIFGGLRHADTPCQAACPGSVTIASNLSKIREGNLREAAIGLLQSNPIPAITGRVCPHFCMQSCNRASFDEPVSIRDIERFVGDYILENSSDLLKAPESSGKSVAIVGSGPAGLSAAYYLRMTGHRVTVFDRMAEAGGMLNYVIPAYRLPQAVVRDTVNTIKGLGVEFKLNTDFGKDINLDSLEKDYDAVFLATGAWEPVLIGIPGETLTVSALTFLTSAKQGNPPDLGDKVAVIGGGNAAIDSARTARRIGVKEVTIVYRRTRDEMPAYPEEIEAALEEGINIEFLTAPTGVSGTPGNLKLDCMRMMLGEPDDDGRRRPEPIAGSEFSNFYTAVISAAGQQPAKLNIKVNAQTLSTERARVFAGGDAVSGPSTVIEAIAAGRRAAAAIDANLRSTGTANTGKSNNSYPLLTFNTDCLEKTERLELPSIPVNDRRIDVEDTRSPDLSEVNAEANRCFNCSCLSVNASDIGVALMALNAEITIAGAGGSRTIPADEFFYSFRNALGEDEIVTEIRVPPLSGDVRQKFVKFRLRESIDFALASAAAVLNVKDGVCQDARVILGAVAPRPVRATGAEEVLIGKPVNENQAEAAALAAVENALPLEKNIYKVTIAREMVRHAILPPEAP